MKENKELFLQIGERIRTARKSAGMTQDKLAELINKTVQYVSDVERGVTGPSIPSLICICRTLCISADYLLLGQNPSSGKYTELDAFQRIQYLSETDFEYINRGVNLLIEGISRR